MRVGLWKHRNCKDMALNILKVQYRGLTYIKVKAYYVHQRTGNLLWETPQTIKIMKKDLKNWEPIII